MPPPRYDLTDDISALLPRAYYSQDDLQILHEIVALATRLPGAQSFRNIWRAYDAVLAARSIDPAFDSLYFRFILHMQGAPGEDLRDKFNAMLDKLGIDVDNTTFVDVPKEVESKYTKARYEEAERRRQGLRGSSSEEEEAYHAEDEARPKKTGRVGLRQLEVRATKVTAGAAAMSDGQQPIAAVKAANQAADIHREELRQRRTSSAQADADDFTSPSIVVESPRVPEDAANHLYELQLRAMLRRYIRHWRDLTVRTVVRRQTQDQQAEVFDRATLLRQAFDTWQEKRWFAVVERRAEARYNQILLVKAWTAWVRRTAAIVQRTHEVRQRILARKYFNAWREHVLENENKVRLFRLAGIFGRWKDATARRREMVDQAAQFYAGNLVHRAYWTWFFKLCGILGPKRHNQILLEQAFKNWRERAEKSTEKTLKANAFCRCRVLQVFFGHWVGQTEINLERQDIAYDHAEFTLMRRIFDSWRRQAIMAPLHNVMVEYSTDRVMYEYFSLWKQRTQHSIVAAELYKRRTAEKALRSWRLQVRERVWAEQHEFIEKRKILKQWVCQERLKLLTRVNDRRVMRRVMTLFKQRCKERKNVLQRAVRRVIIARNRQTAAQIIAYWRQRLQEQRDWEDIADGVYQQNVMTKALSIWRERKDECQEHNEWADDAAYYFTMKRTIRKWRYAVHELRKKKLREAYQMVARNRNRRVAATALQVWQSRTQDIAQLHEIASDFDQSKIREVASYALERWRDKLGEVLDLSDAAQNLHESHLLGTTMSTWYGYYQHLVELHRDADDRYSLIVKYLRRWNTQLWDIQQLKEKGIQLRKRNDALMNRSLLKLWRERLAERRSEQTRFLAVAESTRIQDLEDFSEAVIQRPSFRQNTPAVVPRTPSWKTARGSRLGPLIARTPYRTPGSPLQKFSNFRRSYLGRTTVTAMTEPGVEEGVENEIDHTV